MIKVPKDILGHSESNWVCTETLSSLSGDQKLSTNYYKEKNEKAEFRNKEKKNRRLIVYISGEKKNELLNLFTCKCKSMDGYTCFIHIPWEPVPDQVSYLFLDLGKN